jgi:dTDP-4-dehydrorhamnose 3,5-epimerase
MRAVPTALPGVLVVEPVVHRDGRGFFLETYHAQKYRDAGIVLPFVQDNYSRSEARTLRGLHAQLGPRPQGKLVRAVRGEIFDVAVDVRRGSPTFRRWVAVRLSGDNFLQLWVPPGFLHGFCTLSESADVAYKCTEAWQPADEVSVRWDDPELAIEWPLTAPVLSAKDAAAPTLREVADRLPHVEPSQGSP